jgi:hypothetical protein
MPVSRDPSSGVRRRDEVLRGQLLEELAVVFGEVAVAGRRTQRRLA